MSLAECYFAYVDMLLTNTQCVNCTGLVLVYLKVSHTPNIVGGWIGV